jgi:hypothetical protein
VRILATTDHLQNFIFWIKYFLRSLLQIRITNSYIENSSSVEKKIWLEVIRKTFLWRDGMPSASMTSINLLAELYRAGGGVPLNTSLCAKLPRHEKNFGDEEDFLTETSGGWVCEA